MELPTAIQDYFDADRRHDPKVFASAFAPSAVVDDEGRTYAGLNAIGAWWQATKSKFEYRVEPQSIDMDGGVTAVRGKVTGAFPGSPLTLTYAFRLEHDRISHLEIRP